VLDAARLAPSGGGIDEEKAHAFTSIRIVEIREADFLKFASVFWIEIALEREVPERVAYFLAVGARGIITHGGGVEFEEFFGDLRFARATTGEREGAQ
jgi:hypothetical protein